MKDISEIITIDGVRLLVSKKSYGAAITQEQKKLLEEFMHCLQLTVSKGHKNCCNDCVTKAVWNEALRSYEYINGREYDQ